MKNKQQHDSLQYVFACLFTHSYWIQTVRQDYKQLANHFNLSAEDNQLFYDFILLHFRKILTTAVLSEEKRWREMLTTIKHTSAIFSLEKLKNYWDKYLLSFSPVKPIPASPVLESVLFLSYLLKQLGDDPLKSIIEYEYFRNITFTYEFHTISWSDCIEWDDFDVSNPRLLTLRPKLNPSFLVKTFDSSLSKILQNNASHKPDYIGFYKNMLSKKVNNMCLNESSFAFLMSIPSHGNVLSLIQNFPYSKNVIKKLHKDGVILLTNLI
jgi:hypothetical protein